MENNNLTNNPTKVLNPTNVESIEPAVTDSIEPVENNVTTEEFVATENAVIAKESNDESTPENSRGRIRKLNMLSDLLKCRCGNVNYEKLSKKKNQLLDKIEEHIDE